MTAVPVHPSPTDPSVGVLRDEFRERSGISETNKPFEWISLGPVPVPIPNPPSRRRALRIHDLHHVVTGYGTDLSGEAQVSAWECAAGLHNESVAWIFCPAGTLGGMLRWPIKTVTAYARGRRARTFFGQDADTTDALPLAAAHHWCRTTEPAPTPTIRDWVGALGWAAFGLISVVLPPVAVAIGGTRKPPTTLP